MSPKGETETKENREMQAIATLPKIQFSTAWQTLPNSVERTVVTIDWRNRAILVHKMHRDVLNSVATDVYNGHATRFIVAPGTAKADIVEMVQYYSPDIVDVMNGYRSDTVQEFADYGDESVTKRWVCQGLEWALAGE